MKPQVDQEKRTALESRLAEMMEGRDLVSAGRIQVLGLDRIRQHFGDTWPRLSEKAELLIQQCIERRLTRTDVFSALGELNYVLLFPTLSKAEAQVRCGLIARDISQKLIGDNSLEEHMDIGAVVAEVGGDALENDGFLDAVEEALDQEESDQDAENGANPLAPFATGLSRKERVEGELTRLSEGVSYVFRPLWFVSKSVLSTYFCLPTRIMPSGVQETGYDVIDVSNEPSLIFALDLMVLSRCAAEFAAMQHDGRRFLVSCPVHFETLAGVTSRVDYLKSCDSIPESQRKFLVYELVGLPENAPHSRVFEILSLLKSRCRAVSIRTALDNVDFAAYVGTGAYALGVDAREGRRNEVGQMHLMDRFVGAANKVRLQTYIHGLKSLSLTTAAVCAGFDYVHSDVVLPDMPAPDNIHRFTSTELFKALVGGV